MSTPRPTVPIASVWLVRRGGEHDFHAEAVVLIEREDGTYVECIVEPVLGNFSHCIHAAGIARKFAEGKPVEWLETPQHT